MPNDITTGKAMRRPDNVTRPEPTKVPKKFIEDERVPFGTIVVIGNCRKQDFIVIHELGLVLADLGKLGDDGLCYCESVMPVEPSLPHEFAMPFLNSGTEKVLCKRCHEEFTHELHNRPYQRKHSDKCLRARKALDAFGEWLKTEKAGKAAPVAPEGVNAREKALKDVLQCAKLLVMEFLLEHNDACVCAACKLHHAIQKFEAVK